MAESRLDSLLPDVTTMSDDELMELIRKIRKDRKVTKKYAKVSGTRRQGAADKLDKILATMSPGEIERLKNAWVDRDSDEGD